MWTVPQAPTLKARPTRFREWVEKSGLDFERDVAAWDTVRDAKTIRPKFQSNFKARRRSVSRSSKRSGSALSNVRAAYLGATADSEEGSVADDKVSTIAESAASAVSEDMRLQQELSQLQSGDDAVKFFARHGANCPIKVLYCNRQPEDETEDRGSALCRLVIVPQHKAKPEHFTISANGVLHVCPGEMSECASLSQWIHHGMMFSVLKSMPFFKHFAYQKNFQHWKANARYEAFCRTRQRLSRTCFLARPLFVGALAQVHSLVSDVREIPLLTLSQESQRLSDFVANQTRVRSNPSSGARVQLEHKQDSILEALTNLITSVQQAVAELPGSQDQSRWVSKSKSMVREKQEAREQAKKRQESDRDLASLGNFMRLADYMFQGARMACVVDATLSFCRRLESGNRMFTVDAGFDSAGAILQPQREEFSGELSHVWDGAIQIVSSVPPLASSNQFRKYLDQDIINFQNFQHFEEILSSGGSFRRHTEKIEQLISEQLLAAEAGSNEQYMRYHHIYKFGQQWDEDACSKEVQTFESLSSQIRQMVEFKGELAGFRLHRSFGVVHVNGTGLRNILEPIPEQGLAVSMKLLAVHAHEKCVAAGQQLSAAIKALEERLATTSAVENYKGLCESAEPSLQQAEDLSYDLEDSWHLLAKHGFRISMEAQLQMDTFRTRRRDLEEKLTQAKAFLANLSPDVVVTVHDTHEDWSMTSTGMEDDEARMSPEDLQGEAAHEGIVPAP